MALSQTVLRDLIITKLEAQFGKTPKKAVKTVQKFATAIADAVVSHIQTHAEIQVAVTTATSITTSNSGLQRLPATFIASADTLAPATDKTLTGTGTGTGTLT